MTNSSDHRPDDAPPDSGLHAEPGLGKGLQITIGAVVVTALLGWYGYTNLQQEGTSFQYFQTLDEFMAQPPPAEMGLRVHGYVANASIERDLESKEVRFEVQNDPPHSAGDSDQTLTVLFASLETPDLFKDGAEVVVEGHLRAGPGEPVFVAENVMAKCPSKFEAKLAVDGNPEGDAQL